MNLEISVAEMIEVLKEIKGKPEELFKMMRKEVREVNIFNFAETAKYRFENGTSEEKRKILSSLGSNLYLKDGKLCVDIEKPLLLIEEKSKEIKEIFKKLEPLKDKINREEVEADYLSCPSWRRFISSKSQIILSINHILPIKVIAVPLLPRKR